MSVRSKQQAGRRRLPTVVALAACVFSACLCAQPSHVVRPGETLWGISGQHYRQPGRWPEIQQRNSVGEPRRLQPGTVLYFADGRPLGEGEAMVLAVTGQAWLRRAGRPDAPVAQGMPVQTGDTLATAPDAFLTLGLPDGSRSVIPSSSTVELQTIGRDRVGLRLLGGAIESQVRKRTTGQEFHIRSRSLVLSVRGTQFRVREQGERTVGEVIEGAVAVRDARRPRQVVLEAGHGSVFGGGSDSSGDPAGAAVRTLLAAPRFTSRSVSPATPGVEFEQVPGAQRYRWLIAQDESILAPLVEGSSTGTTLELPKDLQPGFYYLRVTAVDSADLEGMPGDLLFYMPSPTESVRWKDDGRVELLWWGSPHKRYRLEISRDADFSTPLVDMRNMQAGSAIVGPFVVGGRYHWRVSEADDATHYGEPFTGGSIDVPLR
ncbi:FecR domain-containing protein [uncultured Variovorax sp.]|uniref:FecR domain-containing protein n=1 Tax=uncultured Variovorax sp. TaxID=114708 RepID=UPI0025D3195C|nr:FecR domain-containing protein [uncultured Variovorax sp.]